MVLAIYDRAQIIFDGHGDLVVEDTAELLHRNERGRAYKFTSGTEINQLPFAIPQVFLVKVVYEEETRMNEIDVYARLSPLQGQYVPTFYSSATLSVPPVCQSGLNLAPNIGALPALTIEFIDAWTLWDLGQNIGSQMTDDLVQHVCDAMMHSYAELNKVHVRHFDNKGVNVLIRPLPSGFPSLESLYMASNINYQAVIIDFGFSYPQSIPDYAPYGDVNDQDARKVYKKFWAQVEHVRKSGPYPKAYLRQFWRDFTDVEYHL
jgi:hypothetical protein